MRRNIRRHQSRKKLPIFIIIAVIVLGAGAFGVYKWKFANHPLTSSHHTDKPGSTIGNINYDPPSQSEKNASNQQKDQIIQQQNNASGSGSGSSQQNPANLNITIVRAGQISGSSTVQIRTIVTGATSGTCVATLTQSGQATLSQTGTIQVDATSADCSIDIPISSFSTGGTWQLSIVAKASSSISPAATQTVTITK